jgi:hypothetical protein
MVCLNRWIALCLTLLSASLTPTLDRTRLKLSWGLQSRIFYEEDTIPGERLKRSDQVKTLDGIPTQLRVFTFKSHMALDDLMRCSDHHRELWQSYSEDVQKSDKLPSREAFDSVLAKSDPYCTGFARTILPRLYFDFVATSSREHVLDSIAVRTLAVSAYKGGGGFADKEAWYDVIISDSVGRKVYPVETRLRFKDSGRIVLRLLSGKVSPSEGWTTYMANYLLRVEFYFSAGPSSVTVSTEAFKIDL